MSQYFSFYFARKNEDGTFGAVAPFIKEGDRFELSALITRSRSFINSEDFIELSDGRVDLSLMDEHLQNVCYAINFNNKEYSMGYAISLATMYKAAANSGLYQGYVSPADYEYLKEHDFVITEKWELDEFVSPEVVAELGKRDLIKTAFLAWGDTSYIARELVETIQDFLTFNDTSEYYFIFTTEY